MTPEQAIEPMVLLVQWVFVFVIYALAGLGVVGILFHVLGLMGIGKGMPWTKTPDKK